MSSNWTNDATFARKFFNQREAFIRNNRNEIIIITNIGNLNLNGAFLNELKFKYLNFQVGLNVRHRVQVCGCVMHVEIKWRWHPGYPAFYKLP